MNDDLILPPHRELPPEVRERMRADVDRGMAGWPQRTRVLAVAAAVVVFAVGAVVGTQFIRGARDGGQQHDGSATAPVATAVADALDRCWAAVRSAGKTGDVPDRSTWREAGISNEGDDVVVSFTAEGKPLFCETTTTTVTLSDPNARPAYAPGTHTGLLLATPTGAVGGVADPDWPGVDLSMQDGLGITDAPVTGPDRQFAAFTWTDPATTRLWTRRWVDGSALTGPRAELPPAPAPLLSVVDRPGERSSAAGQALGQCLSQVPDPPDRPTAYAPGVLLTDGPYRVVLGTAPGHTLACVTEPDPADPTKSAYRLYLDTFIGDSLMTRRLSVPALGPNGTKVAFVGVVPPSSVSMIADFGLGTPAQIPVANGTFGVWLPAGAKPVEPNGHTWVEPADASGVPTFNGDIPMK